MAYKIESTFTEILSKCVANVDFEEVEDDIKITADQPIMCKVENSALVLTSDQGSHFSLGSSICSFGNNMTVITCNGRTYVNGVDTSTKQTESKDTDFSCEWTIAGVPRVSSLEVQGSSSLRPCAAMLEASITLVVTGSGDIFLPEMEFDSVQASVTGSGDIDFNDAVCKVLQATVTGSGDISGFQATESVQARVTGSGDVKGAAAAKGCKVKKNCTGSGDIKIKQK
jgi:hypothetical protein